MALTSFNYVVPDTSPLFKYTGNSTAWTTWFSVSGALTSQGEFGQGQSYTNSSTVGSGFSLSFHGSSISVTGFANCDYIVNLDGKSIPGTASNGVLYAAQSLADTPHSFNLTLTSVGRSQQLAVSSANITFSAPSNPLAHGLRVDNSNKSVIAYGPSATAWTSSTVAHIPSDDAAPFESTQTPSSYAELKFNGSAVAVSGSVTTGHGGYNITIDGTGRGTFEGSSQWLIGDQILYFESGLGNSPHTIRITNAPDDFGTKLSLNSFIVWGSASGAVASTGISSGDSTPSVVSPSSVPASSSPSLPQNTSSKGSHAGAIVGGVIGGWALIAIIAVVFLLILRRRRRNSQYSSEPRNTMTTLTSPSHNTTVTPFTDLAASQPASSKFSRKMAPPPPTSTSGTSQTLAPRSEQGAPSTAHETAGTASERQESENQVVERLLNIVASRLHLPTAGHDGQVPTAPPPAYGSQ